MIRQIYEVDRLNINYKKLSKIRKCILLTNIFSLTTSDSYNFTDKLG